MVRISVRQRVRKLREATRTNGNPLPQVGDGSVRTQLFTCADAAFNPSNLTVMIDFGALPAAKLPKGSRQTWKLPSSSAWQRYIGVRVITTSPMQSGAFMAWLGLDVDSPVGGYAAGNPIDTYGPGTIR